MYVAPTIRCDDRGLEGRFFTAAMLAGPLEGRPLVPHCGTGKAKVPVCQCTPTYKHSMQGVSTHRSGLTNTDRLQYVMQNAQLAVFARIRRVRDMICDARERTVWLSTRFEHQTYSCHRSPRQTAGRVS